MSKSFLIPPIGAQALGLDYLQKSGDERCDSPNVTLHPLNELPIKSGGQRCTAGQILLQQLHWSLLSPNLITWNNGGWIKLLPWPPRNILAALFDIFQECFGEMFLQYEVRTEDLDRLEQRIDQIALQNSGRGLVTHFQGYNH